MRAWILAVMTLSLLACTKTAEQDAKPKGDPTAAGGEVAKAPKAEKADAPPAPVASAEAMHGVWVVDAQSLASDPDILKLPKAQQEKALQMAHKMVEGMSIEFAAGDKMTLRMGAVTQSGSWTVKKTEGDTLTVDTRIAREGATPREETVRIQFTDKGVLLTGPDDKTVRFVKR